MILGAITQALVKYDIDPGYRPDSTTSKENIGNCFITYRWDRLDNGKYRGLRI